MPIRCVPKSWEEAGAPKLILGNRPDRPINLSRPITFIGQRRDAHVRLAFPGVSSLHAVVAIDSSGAWIYDLASRTGTHLNGQKVTEARLKSEDTLKIGAATLHFLDSRPDLTDESPLVPYSIETKDGMSVGVSGRFFSIGRRPGSNWRLESSDVSLTHAVICQLDEKLFLRDAGSRSGTLLNGLRVSLVQILSGDLFAIGEMKFRVRFSAQEQSEGSIQVYNSEVDSPQVSAPASLQKQSPKIEDLTPELLDSLFGEEEDSESEKAANQALNDTDSVDWGFLKSAMPTIATSDDPPENQKPNS